MFIGQFSRTNLSNLWGIIQVNVLGIVHTLFEIIKHLELSIFIFLCLSNIIKICRLYYTLNNQTIFSKIYELSDYLR